MFTLNTHTHTPPPPPPKIMYMLNTFENAYMASNVPYEYSTICTFTAQIISVKNICSNCSYHIVVTILWHFLTNYVWVQPCFNRKTLPYIVYMDYYYYQ